MSWTSLHQILIMARLIEDLNWGDIEGQGVEASWSCKLHVKQIRSILSFNKKNMPFNKIC